MIQFIKKSLLCAFLLSFSFTSIANESTRQQEESDGVSTIKNIKELDDSVLNRGDYKKRKLSIDLSQSSPSTIVANIKERNLQTDSYTNEELNLIELTVGDVESIEASTCSELYQSGELLTEKFIYIPTTPYASSEIILLQHIRNELQAKNCLDEADLLQNKLKEKIKKRLRVNRLMREQRDLRSDDSNANSHNGTIE